MLAEWKGSKALVLLTKIAASSAFLALGLIHAGKTYYGMLVVAALAFSWIGDILLVWRSHSALMGGIAAFLIAHVAYAVAFATLPLDAAAFGIALVIWNVVVVLLLRWLWKYLDGHDRFAVLIYMAAITIMVSLAAATTTPRGGCQWRISALAAGMTARTFVSCPAVCEAIASSMNGTMAATP